MIGPDGGKKWIKDKWRDQEGARWGDQFIQGQHEWIKTEDVTYVIRTVVIDHAGKDLDAWLSALESLRIPTADAAFKPKVKPQQIKKANQRPRDFTATSLGNFSGHIGAFHAPRDTPHPDDPVRYAFAPQTTGEKDDFHIPLERLLRKHLSATKNNLPGFLTALRKFQTDKLWGGDIEGLDDNAAARIPNDFRAKQDADAKLRGRYTSSYTPGTAIKTTFQEARTVADLQSFAREAKLRNEQIMDNRINAILSLTKPTGIPAPLSNYRPSAPTEAPWISGSGRQVGRRLRPGGGLRRVRARPGRHRRRHADRGRQDARRGLHPGHAQAEAGHEAEAEAGSGVGVGFGVG